MNKIQLKIISYLRKCMLLLKKIMVSTVFGFKLLRCFVTVNPAFEKILSAGVDVAGIFSNEWAILYY